MFEEPVASASPDQLEGVLSEAALASFTDAARNLGKRLGGRTIWHVNSTARGGGVAEMLAPLIAYDTALDNLNRWIVIEPDDDFLHVTKKLHNRLHGDADEGPFDDAQRRIYEATLERESADLVAMIEPGDVVVLHDPQTAGLAEAAKGRGAVVIWRCHIGADHADEVVREARDFLRPYIAHADGLIFSRGAHAWEGIDRDRVAVIAPCIDPLSPKNQDIDPERVAAILATAEIAAGGSGDGTGAALKAKRPHGELLDPQATIVTQVSRWDRLKDPVGVIDGFVEHIAPRSDAHLVLTGPPADEVDDDPEGAEVLRDVRERVSSLPAEAQERIHLFTVGIDDPDQSSLIINALQRRSDVVVQKSLAEGFGLTVTEAMWKARPTVASGVGGIQDQIEDGKTGVLVDDPTDLAAFGSAVIGLLEDPERAKTLGERGKESVRERFLVPTHLMDWYAFLGTTLDRTRSGITCS